MTAVASYPQNDLEDSSGALRLVSYLAAYWTVWYSVHRTPQFQASVAEIAEQEFDHYFIELVLASIDIAEGEQVPGVRGGVVVVDEQIGVAGGVEIAQS